MQCIADIIKSMNVKGYISIDDLYKLSEKDVINKILHCNDEYIRDLILILNHMIDNEKRKK